MPTTFVILDYIFEGSDVPEQNANHTDKTVRQLFGNIDSVDLDLDTIQLSSLFVEGNLFPGFRVNKILDSCQLH